MVPIGAQEDRRKLPGPEDQAQALRVIQKDYASDFAATDLDGRKSLFLLLMQETRQEHRSTWRFVLLGEARRVALTIPSVRHAMLASRRLVSEFDLQAISYLQETLDLLAKRVEGIFESRHLSIAYRQVAKRALARAKTQVTARLLKCSLEWARRSKMKTVIAEIESIQAQFDEIQRLSLEAEAARRRLTTNPLDPADNSTLGTYLCFVLGDWERGSIFLSRAEEVRYRRQIFVDGSGAQEIGVQISIAEGWRRIASRQRGALADLKKAQIVRRSRVWFERALGQSSGVEYHRLKALLGALDEFKRDPLLEPAKKRWFVLFRSNDPDDWNRSVDQGQNHFAVPLRDAPDGLHYLRLRRVDGDQSLIIRMKKSYLGKDIVLISYGWNGTGSFRFGAHHLGIYDTSRKGRRETVEVKFARQGWGFGHRFGDEKHQAWAWDGRPLRVKTVFEIAVTEQALTPDEKKLLLH